MSVADQVDEYAKSCILRYPELSCVAIKFVVSQMENSRVEIFSLEIVTG